MTQDKIRVRVYELVEDGHWKDKGTGNLFIVENPTKVLVVSCEETEKEIISHVINKMIDYELQGESIITWVEPATTSESGIVKEGMDLALSFQQSDACTTVWGWITDILAKLQQEVPKPERLIPIGPPTPMAMATWVLENSQIHIANQAVKCPIPTVNNLPTIIKRLTNSLGRNGDALGINDPAWFDALYDVLKQAEDFKDFNRCTDVWRVLRETIKKGDKTYMDHISSPSQIHKTVHISEYHENLKIEDEIPNSLRKGLKGSCKLVIPGVEMPVNLKAAAQRLYELLYLRNVCLLTCLEEQGQALLNHSIYHANIYVLKLVVDDEVFLENIHKRIKHLVVSELEQDYEDLVLIVSFLRELIMRSKEVQFAKRRELYKVMVFKGVLDGLYRSIKAERVSPAKRSLLWTYVVEAIGVILYGIGVSEMKTFCVNQSKSEEDQPSLLGRLVTSLGENCDEGLQLQIAYLIRCILVCPDPNTPEHMADFLSASTPDIETIWKLFHTDHMETLVSILKRDPSEDFPPPRLRRAQNLVINILRECIHKHDFTNFSPDPLMKNSVRVHSILLNASKLISIPNKQNCPIPNVQLTLSILRLVRACIKPNDDYYIKRITQKHILDNCVKIFVYNGKKQNLLSSTFLSIYDALLKTESSAEKSLTLYIGNRYLHDLKKVDSVLFDSFEERFLQFQEQDKTNPILENELNGLPSEDDEEEEVSIREPPPPSRKKDRDGFIEFVRAPLKEAEDEGSPGLLSKKNFSNTRIKLNLGKKLTFGVKRKLDPTGLPEQKKLKL